MRAAVHARADRRRTGRPLFGRQRRVAISVRIDVDILNQLKAEAARRGIGYQTHLHEVLARAVAKELAK